jgi:hypothetical protein
LLLKSAVTQGTVKNQTTRWERFTALLAYVYFEDEPGRRSAAKLSLGRASAEMMHEERCIICSKS